MWMEGLGTRVDSAGKVSCYVSKAVLVVELIADHPPQLLQLVLELSECIYIGHSTDGLYTPTGGLFETVPGTCQEDYQ